MQGTVVDNRYSIVRTLGDGGMARVYLAHDEVLDRDVALKVLWDMFARDEEFVGRFEREARSAASLSHPNIVQVFDRGETESGTAYMAMEYVTGGTLKDRITREGPLSARDAAAVAIQIAEALGAAHGRGVIHRDIKPHNVLISESGEAKVTDFGIARAAAATTATRTGRVLGTAGYMSPEQALGQRVDGRTDLYSLGVVLFEMLTGRLPFRGESPITVSMKHVNEPAPPPRGIKPDLPEGANALVLKLLAKNPDDRYADAWELIEDLQKLRAGLPLTVASVPRAAANGTTATTEKNGAWLAAAPPRDRQPTRAAPARRRRRRMMPWLLLALLALVLIPLGAIALLNNLGNTGDPGGADGTPAAGGQVKVPDVRGLPQQRAETRLEKVGLEVGLISQFPSDRIEAGHVINPGYPVGKRLDRGTEVNLTVSSGPAQTPTPSASASATSSASASASSEPAAQSTPAGSDASASPTAEPENLPPRDPSAGRPQEPGQGKPDKAKPGKRKGFGAATGGAGGEGEGGED